MNDLIVVIVISIGTGFLLLSALGVLRMPDLYSRMHASTKAGTLGVSCLILAVAIHFSELGISTRSILVIAFLFLTAPVAASMIANAAYFQNVPQWHNTIIDELRDREQGAASHASGGDEDARKS